MQLTTLEIAQRCQRTERTVQRWIQHNTIKALHIQGNLYEVDEDDLQRFLPHEVVDSLSERISALEDRVHTLEGLVSQLTTHTPVRRLTAPRAVYEHKTASQPEGTITLQALADELGINRRTLLDHVRNPEKHLEHIAIPKPGRPGEHERYFTEEQVTAVKDWHAAHKH
ncbi:MAG TPA: hypothetical protein DDW33_03390 [Ktedonobacter sp.]|nr:hypothetical protein [Ktedonobacter sp.]HAT44605.1 hypothetical protein [Ktedonobacter sp.]HBE24714.1 hypothetical protein [Ktedonobacter sp.]HCP73544.1 hypothetical protein [Ktedonobacter sp.]